MKINEITHPKYLSQVSNWTKYRYCFEGGRSFVEKYLERYSAREDYIDFNERKKITPCPAHAKSAILDIKNSIFQRMADVTRSGGPKSYREACLGLQNGVDLFGNSMTGYIGSELLPELLSLGKVGVYVDKPAVEPGSSLAETRMIKPYLYSYEAENIRSWSLDGENRLRTLLLRDHDYITDDKFGLIVGVDYSYRLMTVVEDGVFVQFYDKFGVETNQSFLNIPEIPFVIFELNQSLLQDVADYQIALLNLGSADLHYAIKANFPFYTEQFSPMADATFVRQGLEDSDNEPGTDAAAQVAKQQEVRTGAMQGRRYPQGLERPGFIHPDPDPLRASMELEDRMKTEIRQLVNLALTNIEPTRASAESKRQDEKGLEAGLSYIGLELQYGENEIARLWSMYENDDAATITYPKNYNIRTESERREEAKELEEQMHKTPSLTLKKVLSQEHAQILVGHKVQLDVMQKIKSEIEAAKVIETDADTLRQDHEAGFVSTETASKTRGYPDGEVEQAKKDHAERAARVALAQSKANQAGVASEVGAKDMEPDRRSAELEDTTQPRERGEAK